METEMIMKWNFYIGAAMYVVGITGILLVLWEEMFIHHVGGRVMYTVLGASMGFISMGTRMMED